MLLGNSLAGVNAYQFAARHRDRVSALIVEDIGAVIADNTNFALAWSGTFATREELVAAIGIRCIRLLPYLQESFRQTSTGWRLAFDPQDTVASQSFLNGDHWEDWLGTDCPALLVRGRDSRVTTQGHLEEMANRRANTQLVVLEGGHVPHLDNPVGFANAVRDFLSALKGS